MYFVTLGEVTPMETFARVRLDDGTVELAQVHWYEAAGIGKFEFSIKPVLQVVSMAKSLNGKRQLVVCVRNDEYEVSLELRKIHLSSVDQ